MGNRKKRCAVLMVIVMMMTFLGGCADEVQRRESSIFTGDADALRIFVRRSSTYEEKLKEQFPDIKFDFYHYSGLNATTMMHQLLERDDLGDICFSSLQATNEVAIEHLMNLSGYEFCNRYEPSILSQFDVDGSIYQLPGYVTMRSIVYNKDMFKKYGWKEAKNFDELLALCRQIREDTDDITPIVMGGAANGYYFTTMTSYSQAEFLYTPDGRKWTEEYQEGRAKAEDGFGTGIQMVQELIDADAFDYDKNFDYWDGGLFEEKMLTGEAAMMFMWGAQMAVARKMEEHPEMEFGVIPFRNRAGQAFIGTNIPYYIGLSKTLEEKGNEKKLENAMRILDWLSTEEGISALSSETAASIFPLKHAENAEAMELYRDFWNANLDSIKAPMLYAGYEDILVPTADVIAEAVQKKGSLDGLADYIDEIHQAYVKANLEGIEIGSFERDFSHAETIQMFAHILQEKGDSDITLVSDGIQKDGVANQGGVFGSFLEGSMIEDQLTCSLPGMGLSEPAVQLTLTGRQVKNLLENGKHGVVKANFSETYQTESDEGAIASASFDYYWEGMEVKWKKGKVVSMKLSDGRILEDDETCKVTFPYGDYTEETAQMGSPKELSYTTKDVLQEYMEQNSPVSPVPVLR